MGDWEKEGVIGQGMRDSDWESEGMGSGSRDERLGKRGNEQGDGRLGERGSERAEWAEGWEIRRERE